MADSTVVEPSKPISEPENIPATSNPSSPDVTQNRTDNSNLQALNDLKSLGDYFTKEFGKFQDQLGKMEKLSALHDKRFEVDENKIEESKNKNIESLGLFVALFTFISVEFSLFKEVSNFNAAIALTLIIAGLLLFFVLVLHLIIKNETKKHIGFDFFAYGLLTLGIISLIWLGIHYQDYYKKGDYYIKLSPTPTTTIIPSPTITTVVPENK